MYIYCGEIDARHLAELQQRAAKVDLRSGPGGSGMSDPLATEFELGAAVITATNWRHEVRHMRVVGLWPSQQIALHQDAPLAPGVVRYHLPLVTNDGCWSYAGGVWRHLHAGCIYRLDPTEEHGAVNWGGEVRVHLMIDVREGYRARPAR